MTHIDVELVVRDWLRAELLSADGRVFLSFPEGDTITDALVVLQLIGAPTDEMTQEALVQFDVFASERVGAETTSRELCAVLEGLNTSPADEVLGAYGVTRSRAYGVDDPLRRYMVQAVLTVRVSA